jgi:hypothetical protein
MGRKKRKQERRLKSRPLKTFSRAEISALARILVPFMVPAPPELIGKRYFCQSCNMSWEYAYDGKLVFCHECFAFSYCIKEIKGFKTCKICERR